MGCELGRFDISKPQRAVAFEAAAPKASFAAHDFTKKHTIQASVLHYTPFCKQKFTFFCQKSFFFYIFSFSACIAKYYVL